jgi:hypothetical protein
MMPSVPDAEAAGGDGDEPCRKHDHAEEQDLNCSIGE